MAAAVKRRLGVVEAMIAARDQCPNAAVRAVAEQALEALKPGQSGSLREQAFLLISAMQGWRGDRASEVHDALKAFLREGDPKRES